MKKQILVQVQVDSGEYTTIEEALKDVEQTLISRDYPVEGVFLEVKSMIAYGWNHKR